MKCVILGLIKLHQLIIIAQVLHLDQVIVAQVAFLRLRRTTWNIGLISLLLWFHHIHRAIRDNLLNIEAL